MLERISPLLLLAIATLAGCGGTDDGPERVVVTGTVTYDGDPLPSGKIRFVPKEGTTGPVAVGLIEDGRYTVDSRGGVPVGEHRVEFEAFRDVPGAEPVSEELARDFSEMQAGEVPQEQYLPDKYLGDRSTLEATIENTGEGPVTKDFDLAR